MNDKRQKNQLPMVLALTGEGRSEAPKAPREGIESFTAKCETESPAEEQLMEEVCERENCQQALRRVKANKGSPGIDNMRVEELPGYLKQHWPALREQRLRGSYQPQPVRRVEIKKPDGGVRKLVIPTVLDRIYPPGRFKCPQIPARNSLKIHRIPFLTNIADCNINIAIGK